MKIKKRTTKLSRRITKTKIRSSQKFESEMIEVRLIAKLQHDGKIKNF